MARSASAVAPRRRRPAVGSKKKRAARRRAAGRQRVVVDDLALPARPLGPPTVGWWGDGPSPLEQWPGVTLDFDAVWVEARERWESRDGRFYFDTEDAQRYVEFFPSYLKHHIGEFAGQPFVLMDYQRLLLTMPMFGWKRASDNRRRFKKLFAFLPKGAGKSPWGAGTALELTLIDKEPAAEVYAMAADKNQARVVFDNARVMVEEDETLLGMCEVLKDSIYRPGTRSRLQVLSADASTKHGFRPSGAVFDEFHAQPDRDLYEAIKKSMVKRRQPMLIIITHAGEDDEGICYEEYELAKRILSGNATVEDTLPVIFEASKEDDWTSPDVWRRVNPGHGITVQHEGIAAECQEAQADPRKLNDFLRYHLNRWVNAATAWIPVDWWDECGKQPLEEDDVLATLDCAAGLDLAQKWDLACFCIAFRVPLLSKPDEPAPGVEIVAEGAKSGDVSKKTVELNYRISLLPFFWIPEETMREHEKQDDVPYSIWRETLFRGVPLVTATDGNIIDYSRIYSDIVDKILPRFPLLKGAPIGYDEWTATDIATKLRDLANFQVEPVSQNYSSLSETSQVMEALIKAGRVRHGGHRVLRWNWENAVIKQDDLKRIRPVKPKNPAKRVDGVLASIMALKVLNRKPVRKRSIYETRGVTVI